MNVGDVVVIRRAGPHGRKFKVMAIIEPDMWIQEVEGGNNFFGLTKSYQRVSDAR